MFDQLIESRPKKERTAKQTTVSVIFHVVLIFGAVKATQGAAEAVQALNLDTMDMFIKPPEPPPPPDVPPPPPDQVVAANPPPQGFQTIVPPKDLPTEIPPIDLNEKFDASNYTGRGVEGGVATGVIGGTGPVTLGAISAGEMFTVDQVDDPVVRTGGPNPRYPSVMEAAGITGSVVLRFIVSATGQLEPGSIQVVSSTNKAFEEPAMETIRRSTFRAARMRGQGVRQLVQQTVAFTLSR